MLLKEEVKKGPGTKYLYLKNGREFSPEIWCTSFSHEYKLTCQKSVKSEKMGDTACLISYGMTLYSSVPNNLEGLNSRVGWKFPRYLISGGGGRRVIINRGDGKLKILCIYSKCLETNIYKQKPHMNFKH